MFLQESKFFPFYILIKISLGEIARELEHSTTTRPECFELDKRFCRLWKKAYTLSFLSSLLVTFEDKRKANYERGNMELEKRRQALMEQQQREAERKAQKEKEEWERKQRELQEQEWKKQLELEKRLEKQRELERQREEERRKELERREVIFEFFPKKITGLMSEHMASPETVLPFLL